mgnify:CR=1 FL=1
MKKKIFYVHTDFAQYFFAHKKKNKDPSLVLNEMMKDIKKVTNSNFIIPTYNFNFGKTKIYNYFNDKSEIGIFSEFFRKKFEGHRTFTPIWSDCFFKKKKFKIEKKIYPFGKKSIFDYLDKNNGFIISFGSKFSPTFIHFIESCCLEAIPYRLEKNLSGIIKIKKKAVPVKLIFHVKSEKHKTNYDLNKLEKVLVKEKLLKYKNTLNNFRYSIINANKFKNFVLKKLKKNPLYLLKSKPKLDLKFKV